MALAPVRLCDPLFVFSPQNYGPLLSAHLAVSETPSAAALPPRGPPLSPPLAPARTVTAGSASRHRLGRCHSSPSPCALALLVLRRRLETKAQEKNNKRASLSRAAAPLPAASALRPNSGRAPRRSALYRGARTSLTSISRPTRVSRGDSGFKLFIFYFHLVSSTIFS